MTAGLQRSDGKYTADPLISILARVVKNGFNTTEASMPNNEKLGLT